MSARTHQDISADQIPWRPGSDPRISYARFRTDDDNPDAPAIVLSRFEPGAIVPPHTHGTNYFEYIVAGEQTVGKVRFGAGDVRIVREGAGYGPITVGPEGCTVLIVFENGAGAATETLPRKRRAAVPA